MLVSKTSPSHARQRAETWARTTGEARLAVVLGHPSPLVVPAVLADTASHICGIGAVLEVAAAGCRERSLEFCRPLPVGLGQSPHLVRCQSKVTNNSPKRTRHRYRLGVAAAARPGVAAALWPCRMFVGCRRAHGGRVCSGSRCASLPRCRGVLWSPQNASGPLPLSVA